MVLSNSFARILQITSIILITLVSSLSLKLNSQCLLSNMKWEKSSCTAEKSFYVTLNFSHEGNSDFFNLIGNGRKYGTFEYSKLPIKIGPFKADCTTEYEFVAYNTKDEKCNASALIGKVCCETQLECKLSELTLTKSECDAKGNFLIKIKFKYENTSDSFNVFDHNRKQIGRFAYAKMPIVLGPFPGDCITKYFITIRDYKTEKCSLEKEIGTVCCSINSDCNLNGLKIEKTECNAEKQFYAILNFTYKNTSDCFTVNGNGVNYGTFNYANLPIKIGPLKGNCETNYEFVIRDCKNERCAIEGALGKVCCETGSVDCMLSNLKIIKTSCTSDKVFFTYINFHYKNTSECFTINGNGINYGTFKYSQLPLKLGPHKGNCETNYEFVIRDCKNEKCTIGSSIGKVCCEGTGGTECNLSELNITKSECNEDGTFTVKLNFNYKNTSECFVLRQNDNILGKFPYTKLPLVLGPFKGDCTTEYVFSVVDCVNENCATKKLLGKVCCETQNEDCKLSNLKFERSECDAEKNFYAYFNFTHQNTSECFTVTGNGVDYGRFKYADLPIKIGPLKGNCETPYEFVITDCERKDCSIRKELGKVCCETQGNCEMGDLQVTKSECDKEGNFKVKLNFKYANVSDCFVLMVNGKPVSKYLYTMLPVELGPYPGDCKTEYIFQVYDCNNESCATKALLGKVCCETQNEDCKLSDLKIEKTPCEADKTFYAIINFAHAKTSDCFIVTGNGIKYGSFMYSQLPIKIGPLKANCETEYEFSIRDCEMERCTISGSLGKVCCEGQNLCELSNLEISRGDCNADGNFLVKLNFKYKNVSECFIVRQNNNILGKFKYSQLPLQLGPFKGDCTTNYTFTITDCLSEKCSIRKEIGRVCCKPVLNSCMISDLKYEKTTCNENKEVYLMVKFVYKNTSECFTASLNGRSLGTFEYKNLPIKIGPIKADCETKYNLVIRDCKSERCGLEYAIGTLCCDKLGAACEISKLEVKALECTGTGQYAVKLNFTHTGTKGVGFDVYDQNGKSLGFYSYNTLPLILKEFKASGNEVDYIKVCENDNERCCAEIKFAAIKCLKGTTGGFNLNQVELRYSNDHIILFSENSFPENFDFIINDMNGKSIIIEQAYRDQHYILIPTVSLQNGMYLVNMQNSYDLRNMKFIK